MKTKTILFSLFALLMSEKLAAASSLARGKTPLFAFYPETGLNYSSLAKENKIVREGFGAGMHLRFGRRLYVQGGARFINARYEVGVGNPPSVEKTDSWYMNYPLLIGFAPLNRELVNIRFFAGATGSYFLGSTVSNTALTGADFSKSLWSVTCGAGFDVWRFTLNLSHDFGLSEISILYPEKRLRITTFGLGFKFY